jgi:hypothetical protein
MILEKTTSFDWQDGAPKPKCYLCFDDRRYPDMKYVTRRGHKTFVHLECVTKYGYPLCKESP